MKNDILRMLDVLIDNTVELLPKFLMALVVLLGGYFIGRIIEKIIRRLILYIDSSVNQALQQKKIDIDLKDSGKVYFPNGLLDYHRDLGFN